MYVRNITVAANHYKRKPAAPTTRASVLIPLLSQKWPFFTSSFTLITRSRTTAFNPLNSAPPSPQ